jgi:hypothetical protein
MRSNRCSPGEERTCPGLGVMSQFDPETDIGQLVSAIDLSKPAPSCAPVQTGNVLSGPMQGVALVIWTFRVKAA